MNIKLTHSMLLEYLDTDATPEQIQEYVSLGGPNVETIEKVGNEHVYDIEVTSNRIDAASAFGFALECAAILPKYGKKAQLKNNPLQNTEFPKIDTSDKLSLKINLSNPDLATRLVAVILTGVHISKSPEHIAHQLEACGERSINNVVDISNYIRLMLGHPVHIFDYNKIKGAAMTIRLSKKGESITTLDKRIIDLPGDDIVIEDTEGNIIDLAGIMGAANTEVDDATSNIVLFVPTFVGRFIRQTSMKTNQRTNAVAYFEKNVDPERAVATLALGVRLLKEHSDAKVNSEIIDIYPKKREGVEVTTTTDYVNKVMSTDLKVEEIQELIKPLGFETEADDNKLTVKVPSYRAGDVTGPSDIVEEVARIYGYHNIPGSVQMGEAIYQPIELQRLFNSQSAVRTYLCAVGFNEQYNYSMVSEKLLKAFGPDKDAHLHLTNTISEEIEYMRTSLAPSLVKNMGDNKGAQPEFNFFECARVYLSRKKDLPEEQERIGIASTQGFSYVMGIVENITQLLKIEGVTFEPSTSVAFVVEKASATIKIGDLEVGYIGKLQRAIGAELGIEASVTVAELYLPKILEHIRAFTKYVEPSKYALIKFDLTYTSDPEHTYSSIVDKIYKASSHVRSTNLLSQYEDNVTIRIEFGDNDKNMTEEEAKVEFDKVKESVLR